MLRLLPFLLVPASFLPAQTPPGLLRGLHRSKVFDGALSGFSQIARAVWQISFERLPGDAAGAWTCCMSVVGLPSSLGGQKGIDVVMGTYDQVKGTFVPNLYAAALNRPAAMTYSMDFALMLEPRLGRYAVLDHIQSAPVLATRTLFNKPFGAPRMITGVKGISYGPSYFGSDPALGYVGGKLKLFYSATISGKHGVWMDDLDPSKPSVSGNPVLVCLPTVASGLLSSITPVTGPDGDVEGLYLADAPSSTGADSDMVFADDLDPATPFVKLIDTPGWLNNGGITGGRFHFADDAAPINQAVKQADGAWMLGDVEAPGGTADLFGAAFNDAPGKPLVTIVWLGVGFAPQPIQLPGFFGSFGLDLRGPVLPIGTMSHLDASQTARLSFPLPNDTRLRGSYALQGLSIQPATGQNVFTNTFRLVVR